MALVAACLGLLALLVLQFSEGPPSMCLARGRGEIHARVTVFTLSPRRDMSVVVLIHVILIATL